MYKKEMYMYCFCSFVPYPNKHTYHNGHEDLSQIRQKGKVEKGNVHELFL